MSKKLSGFLRKFAVALVMPILLTMLPVKAAPAEAESLGAQVVNAAGMESYVGHCLNSLTGEYESQAINVSGHTIEKDSDVYEEYYEVIETTEQLKTFTSEVTEGKVSAGAFGFTADASISKKVEETVETTNNSLALVYMVRYNGPKVVLQGGKFTQDAVNLIEAGRVDDFEAQYGNSFVKNAHLGGVLIISYRVDTHNLTAETKEEYKKALKIKGKFLTDSSVTDSELREANRTLSNAHTVAKGLSTDGSPVAVSEIIDNRENFSKRVKQFTDYYNKTQKYEVLGVRLDAMYNLPGSGYGQSDKNKFPVFYDPELFTTSNMNAKSDATDKSRVTLSWQDSCTYEDRFDIYVMSTSMDTPQLIDSTAANTTSKLVILPDDAWQDGCLIWAVPVKKEIKGRTVKPAIIDAAYYVTFYEHDNFGGRESTFCGSYIEIPDFNRTNVGNDTVNSILISGPYHVECYRDYNYTGLGHPIRFSDVSLNDEVGRDKLSSAKIKRLTKNEYEGVYIYRHDWYNGQWVQITSDISNFKDTWVGNDGASSIRVVGPYECTVFENTNFWGTSHTYRFDDYSMRDDPIGNDRVSSATAAKRLSDDERNGVYLFQHSDYTGKWMKITNSISNLLGTWIGDNDADSVKVIGPYKYTLYADPNYTGNKYSSDQDLSTTASTPIGINKLSSVKVEKEDTLSAFEAIETELYDAASGITVDPDDDDYIIVSKNGYTVYNNVDFDDGAIMFYACTKKNKTSGPFNIEVRLDSRYGTLIGTLVFDPTSGWKEYSCDTTKVSGIHNLYLVYSGNFYLDYIYFEEP